MELEWINLTEDLGVQKRILKTGDGEMPKNNWRCKVKYAGRLEDGTEFDSNLNSEKPFKFTLGQGQVIKGWDIGVASMKTGEKAELRISSQYGYGDEGQPPKIPGKATLIFEVELVACKEKKKSRWQMNDEEKLAEGRVLKEKGNQAYKEKNYSEAKKHYKSALDYLEIESEECKELKCSVHLNLSITHFMLKEFSDSKEQATKCLESKPGDQQKVKAYYRRAVGHIGLCDYEEGKKDLMAGLELDPQNEAIKEELRSLKRKMAEAKQKERQLFGRLFEQRYYEEEKKEGEKKEVEVEEPKAQSNHEQSSTSA